MRAFSSILKFIALACVAILIAFCSDFLTTAKPNMVQTPKQDHQDVQSNSNATLLWSIVSVTLVWIAQGLMTFALRRFHLVRTLKVDLAHRCGSGANVYFLVQQWWKHLESLSLEEMLRLSELPNLVPRHESHVVYRNLQPQMVESLWKDEIRDVRTAYRWLELIEGRLETIRNSYEQIIPLLTELKCSDRSKKDASRNLLLYYKNEIVKCIERYKEILGNLFTPGETDFWEDEAKKGSGQRPFELNSSEIIQSLMDRFGNKVFLRIHVAYGTQLISPLLVISWFLALFISRPFHVPIGILFYCSPVIFAPFLFLLWRIERKGKFQWFMPSLICVFLYSVFFSLAKVGDSAGHPTWLIWIWALFGVVMLTLGIRSFCRENTDLGPKWVTWLKEFWPSDHRIFNFSQSSLEIGVNDFRRNGRKSGTLVDAIRKEIEKSLFGPLGGRVRCVLTVDVVEHQSVFTSGIWRSTTLLRWRIEWKDSHLLIKQGIALGESSESSITEYVTAATISQNSFDAAVTDLLRAVSSVQLGCHLLPT
jgi:hypothetical protein